MVRTVGDRGRRSQVPTGPNPARNSADRHGSARREAPYARHMDVLAAVCAVVVLLVVVVRPRLGLVDALTALAGAVSLVTTALAPRTGALPRDALVLGAVETGALLLLVVLAARRSGRIVCVLPAALAVGAWILRIEPPTSGPVLVGCATWLAAALGAAGGGAYLRGLDAAKRRAVQESRSRQRVLMAQELHDFLAHDVTEVLALAQAGQVLASGSEQLPEVLQGIERSARRALCSMDRTLDVLDADARHPTPALAEIPGLVDQFASSFSAAVHVEMDVKEPDGISRETGAAAYRIVMEALTNVRRHAPTASRVDVRLTHRGSELAVEVSDDGEGTAATRARGERGLAALAERAGLLGGSLRAGRGATAGWCTSATLPVGRR